MRHSNRPGRLVAVAGVVVVLLVVGAVVVVRALGSSDDRSDRSPSAALGEAVDQGELAGLIRGRSGEQDVVPGATPAERARFVLTDVDWDAERASDVADAVRWVSQDDGGDDFVAALVEGTPPPATGRDGLMALALADAAAKSLAEGRLVRLSEILADAPAEPVQ